MNTKRLTILRDALIEYAKNPGNLEFDLGDWANVPNKHWDALENVLDPYAMAITRARKGQNFCGTTACALGLATTIPAFKRAGLRDPCCPEFDDGWDLHIGTGAGAAFFGIAHEDAEELFLPNKYGPQDRKNPLAVADKITALLNCA